MSTSSAGGQALLPAGDAAPLANRDLRRLPRRSRVARASLILLCALSLDASAQASYVLFEGGPVRPVTLSPDGRQLFVVNSPDGHLEIFDVRPNGALVPRGSVQVGVEPVAVAARDDGEVWVVNHLSDSVSIVDVTGEPRVVRTLLVGDEPRDIVFAGAGRAFISTAHRGQHRDDESLLTVPGAGDPQLTTEGIGRADVWVFDAANLGTAFGGVPIEILSFMADTPRALATDGSTVYVAAFHSGNQTTAISETIVPDGFASDCGRDGVGIAVPGPSDNADGEPAPETGLLVKFDGTDWVDVLGCTWNRAVKFDLPDHDVFSIDAATLAPGPVAEFDHVGTILFNMAVNPVSGKIYVTNTDSHNEVRFEGPGDHGGSTVQGRLSESRITVLDPTGPSVDPQHLNQHIDYSMLHTDAGADHVAIDAQIPHSLATPLQLVVSNELENQRVYVAAFGSAKVGVFDASDLEDPFFETNFDPTAESANYIQTLGGPAGLALNATNDRLYVFTRFDHAISVYAVGGETSRLLQSVKLASAEPTSIVEGRPLLYDAVATSGNGEASCASCHIFGDFDSLAWNLGNPDAPSTTNPQRMIPFGEAQDFHPMKGPLTTQTLRGLSTHGALHWRGDRANGFFGQDPCTEPSGAACDEQLSFDNFIVAFERLLGRDGSIPEADMQRLTDFALQLALPPNPIAALDGRKTFAQRLGEQFFFVENCSFCHRLDPALGFFGTGGDQGLTLGSQMFKIPHLRNVYQKVGMFGRVGAAQLGDQVRGFGVQPDGALDTVASFLATRGFALNASQISSLQEYVLVFPTDLAPVVGQQVSIAPESFANAAVNDRIDLLDIRAGTPFTSLASGGVTTECELIANTVEGNAQKGYTRQASGLFRPDDGTADITEATLRSQADPLGGAQHVTYTCVPPGSGHRTGIDRDVDGALDGSDNCPAWPNDSALGSCTAGDTALLASRCTASSDCGIGGFCSLAQEDGDGDGVGDACELSLLPEPSLPSMSATSLALLWLLARESRRTRKP
jgi:YVTN family beta-propeller protein